MKQLFLLALFLILPACSNVGNEGGSRSGIARDEGYVKGSIKNIKGKSVRIEVINEIERNGELASDSKAQQKGVKAGTQTNLDAQ
jgi:hypothetical protein